MRGLLGKRGQFFILAAVIISSIVLSLGATSNYVLTNKNERDYDSFSYGVKKETGEVIDYSIYSGFNNNEDLEDFISLLSVYVADKEPESSFMFIYGDLKSVTVENHGIGVADVSAGGQFGDFDSATAGESKIKSKISIGGVSSDIFGSYDALGGFGSKITLDNNGHGFSEGDFIEVNTLTRNFKFSISKYKQVIFLIQKEAGNEIYIATR